MLNAIKSAGAAATFVDSTFQSDVGAKLSVNENLKNKKRCVVILVYAYLSGETIPHIVTTYGATYKLEPKVYDVFDRIAKHSPPSVQLIQVTKAMSDAYNTFSISNLPAFLEKIFNEKDTIMNYFNELSFSFRYSRQRRYV